MARDPFERAEMAARDLMACSTDYVEEFIDQFVELPGDEEFKEFEEDEAPCEPVTSRPARR